MVSKFGIVWRVLLLLPLCGALHADEIVDRHGDSIVKIHVTHPLGKEVAATGFVFGRNDQVVTSLHVVAGAKRIQIKVPSNGRLISAEITRVLRDQDLAMLRLKEPTKASPLEVSKKTPSVRDELTCIGYPFNIRVADPTFLKVRSTGGRLRDSIPTAVRNDLEKIGFPSTDTPVFNLDGHLLPGHSGAPIFDSNGMLVAIANGGLAVGAASRSWAVNAGYLEALLNSKATIPDQSVANTELFAEEVAPTTQREFVVADGGDERLLLIRTASFSQMLSTTDDQRGLRQIASMFPFDPSSQEFDIYRESESGATLVVPSGYSAPRWQNGIWITDSEDHLVSFYFQINKVSNPDETQLKSSQFEHTTVQFDNPMYWSLDPNWTYPTARPTLQGMEVRRLAYVQFLPTQFGPQQTKQMIVTHSLRGDVMLSAAAKLNDQSALFGYSQQPARIWLAGASSAFLTTLSE
ncbi:MAG: serine protease [Gammaproteobacteria bacterium]|nr:serine protease [Gammaproteobacteria bacterium]